VRLSDDLRETLDALCERHSETQAGVIRLALAALAKRP
jgi:predicted transcriptional regulator